MKLMETALGVVRNQESLLLRTDGTTETLLVGFSNNYATVAKVLGAKYVECLPFYSGPLVQQAAVIVDEEELLSQNPILNERASAVFGPHVNIHKFYGNVVVVPYE